MPDTSDHSAELREALQRQHDPRRTESPTEAIQRLNEADWALMNEVVAAARLVRIRMTWIEGTAERPSVWAVSNDYVAALDDALRRLTPAVPGRPQER